MMHQPVDLDDYSPLEIEMNMWERNIEPGSVTTAADAVGETNRNAMTPSKALNVEKSMRAGSNSETASAAVNGSMEGFCAQIRFGMAHVEQYSSRCNSLRKTY